VKSIYVFIIAYGVHHLVITSITILFFTVFIRKKSPPNNRGTATKTNCYERNTVYAKKLFKDSFF